MQSAEALMLGMYPLNNNSTTQTVELFTMDPTNDYMTVNPKWVTTVLNYNCICNWDVYYLLLHKLLALHEGYCQLPNYMTHSSLTS